MQCLVEGTARRVQALGENVDRHIVESDGDQDLALVARELFVDGIPHGAEQLVRLRLAVRGSTAVCHQSPVLGVECDLAAVPGSPARLGARLEQGELVGPGREAARAAIVVELGEDGHERVVGTLLGEVLTLGSEPRRRRRAAADLKARGPQQQLVQASHGSLSL